MDETTPWCDHAYAVNRFFNQSSYRENFSCHLHQLQPKNKESSQPHSVYLVVVKMWWVAASGFKLSSKTLLSLTPAGLISGLCPETVTRFRCSRLVFESQETLGDKSSTSTSPVKTSGETRSFHAEVSGGCVTWAEGSSRSRRLIIPLTSAIDWAPSSPVLYEASARPAAFLMRAHLTTESWWVHSVVRWSCHSQRGRLDSKFSVFIYSDANNTTTQYKGGAALQGGRKPNICCDVCASTWVYIQPHSMGGGKMDTV